MQNQQSLYILVPLFLTGVITQCLAVKKIKVLEGKTLTLTCPLNNTMNDSVEWRNPGGHVLYLNRQKGISDKRLEVVSLTKSEYTITLSNATFLDGGVYKCKHYNNHIPTKRYKVDVLSAPVLEIAEHVDHTVVTCTASATGHAPRISWLVKNGLEIENLYNVMKDEMKKHTAISHLHLRIHRRKVTVQCMVKYPALDGFTLMGSIHLQNSSIEEHHKPKYSSPTPVSTKTTIISTFAPQFTMNKEGLTTSEYPSTPYGSTQTLTIPTSTPYSTSTSKEELTTEEYSSTSVVSTEPPVISRQSTRFHSYSSGYSESETTDSVTEINTTLYNNTQDNDTTDLIFETTEGTLSNTSINSSSNSIGVEDGNKHIKRQSRVKGNSALLVLLVTCLIICLIIVLAFFLLRLRRAHVAWKKENEESDQSVDSSRSKSSSEEKQKQAQQQRERGFWNTSFTKYKMEETPETDTKVTSASVEVIHENPECLNHISKSGVKETEL